MRYPKGLEVLLLKPNSTETYAEVEHGSCKFAIGEAGKPFWVLVQVPQQAFSYADTIHVQLYVEGQRPGYTYTLHRARTCCTFKGYGSVLDGQQRYKHFQFAEPSSAAHAAAPAPAAEAGQLRVKFTHVVERSRQRGAGSLSATPFPTAHQHDECKTSPAFYTGPCLQTLELQQAPFLCSSRCYAVAEVAVLQIRNGMSSLPSQSDQEQSLTPLHWIMLHKTQWQN